MLARCCLADAFELAVFTVRCTSCSTVISSTRATWSITKQHAPSARCVTCRHRSCTGPSLVRAELTTAPLSLDANPLSAFAVLQLFLSSPKSTLKFAAIRTLATLAQTQPVAVQTCNLDMEKLINDDNRSVATFAITTLLKVSRCSSSLLMLPADQLICRPETRHPSTD